MADGEASSAEALAAGIAEIQNTLAVAVVPARHRARLREIVEELQKRLRAEQKASAADAGAALRERLDALIAAAAVVGSTRVVIGELPEAPMDQLKHAADIVKQRCGSAAVVFGVHVAATEKEPEKATLLVCVSDDVVKRGVRAGELVKAVAPLIEGAGGGPPTMAQAGGKRPERLGEALEAAREWLSGKLA